MSWRPDISGSRKPKYLALVEAIERDIRSGTLRDGDRLPPQREIAAGLDITIATLTKAIQEAARRGLVTARAGSGTFVRGAESAAPPEPAAFDMSLNTVPSAPAKPFLDAALETLGARRASELLCAYEPATGTEAHRAMMARWLRQRALLASPGSLLLTHGGQHGLAACFHVLAKPGDVVLCESWTYTGIRRLGELCHVRIEGVAMDQEGLEPGDLADRLAATGARLVICTAAVQNPTTATMSLERRREVVAVCASAGALLVEDDIYGGLSGDPLPPLAALAPDRVVHISSVSKCLAPGVRLGAVVAPDQLVSPLRNALMSLQWTAPTFWAEMLGVMLETGTLERCVAAQRREALRRLALFRDVVGVAPSTALPSFHTWLAVPPQWSIDDFMAALLTMGIKVSPDEHFAVPHPRGRPAPFVRVCLGGGDDTAPLVDQLSRLRSVLAGEALPAVTIT